MPKTISAAELPGLTGTILEPSSWLKITQQRINQFADATNDHQFIHVSRIKAALTPFRKPIAHGFLSLSLLSYLNAENALIPDNLKMIINYGSEKPGQWLVKTEVSVEIEGEEKPALVATMLTLMIVA